MVFQTLSAEGVSTLFINGKPAIINDVIKLRNPPFWVVILLAVPFNKIPLCSKDLIIFISFASLFVSVYHEPSLVVNSLLSLFVILFT